jgi:transcriptional regulator with XRE-family HTH domain
MGRRVADIDERDRQVRVDVRSRLRTRRQQLGWSQRQVGELLGSHPANIRRLEREGVDQSYAISVMRWARVLGLRLVLQPVGFPPPAVQVGDAVDDLLTAVAGDIRGSGDLDDAWEMTRIMGQLVGVRLACRVTRPQLAKRIGTTEQNVSLIETAGSSTALVVLQRHARAVAKCSWRPDAYLSVSLEETTQVV